MSTSRNLIIIFGFLHLSSFSIANDLTSKKIQTLKIVGTALNLAKNKQFFYTEEDIVLVKDNHIQKIDASYKDKDSKLIVEMHSVFTTKPYLPEITFKDHRKGIEFKMIYLESENVVSISQNFSDQKVVKTKKIPFVENMTNSMGLINYIRENFSGAKQKSNTFRYVIPALGDDYGMILAPRENPDNSEAVVRFAFRIQSFFIRNLSGVHESIIKFDEGGSFIKGFQGISNVLDETSHAVEVQIDYSEPVVVKTK